MHNDEYVVCLQVVCPPYKINTLITFSSRILCTPPNILRDFIRIMRMELVRLVPSH